MKQTIESTPNDLLNSAVVNNWMSSSALVAAGIAGLVWIFRMAVRDQVKKEIDPLAADISAMKIEIAVIKKGIESIRTNTHAIKNSEAAEQGTLIEVLTALSEIKGTIKRQNDTR